MAKFSLAVKPTFKSKIDMPVHGGGTKEVELEFKHRTRDQLAEFHKSLEKKNDIDMLEEILVGWDMVEPFHRDSVEQLVQNFYGAPLIILRNYFAELHQAREKN